MNPSVTVFRMRELNFLGKRSDRVFFFLSFFLSFLE